ncbi:MAG: TonB family protein [Acetobacter fabarum]|nr:TonB family protein [Acetobacter fabarum]MCH4084905.1 TonB family protein [Acetobacter fabarum]MCI1447454.1 TonB family protein [Acetobacter fabarum]MCI1492817.1 TonB family protein [Acetobacter fabarum]MCI1506010.1 TonB family protein [Acetobacter fabarum]
MSNGKIAGKWAIPTHTILMRGKGELGQSMVDTRRSSTRPNTALPNRQEPRLQPARPLSAPPPAEVEGGAGQRPRLFPFMPVPKPPGGPVRGSSTPLIRKDIYADPTLGPVFTASALAHFLLLAALLYQATHHGKTGSPQSNQASPVEMVFSQPTTSSGMVGPHSPEAGGGNAAPQAAPPPPAEQQPDTQKSPPEASEAAPDVPPLAQSDDGFPKPQPTPQKARPTPHKSTSKPSSRAVPRPQPQQLPQNLKSLLQHPMDYSFNEAPAPRRPNRRGRPGGSNAPLDMSIGPMVENGQLNAHYASRTSVHGVSSDYGQEIDAWIQRHLFYPPEAAERGEEGSTSVHVILDRSGHVFKVFMSGSSTPALDASTVGMFQGAQLPPVPPDMKDQYINFDVTVHYVLIRN